MFAVTFFRHLSGHRQSCPHRVMEMTLVKNNCVKEYCTMVLSVVGRQVRTFGKKVVTSAERVLPFGMTGMALAVPAQPGMTCCWVYYCYKNGPAC